MKDSHSISSANAHAIFILTIAFLALTAALYAPLMSWVIILSVCAVVVRLSVYLGWYTKLPETRTINLLSVLTVIALAWLGWQQGLLLSMVNLLVSACSLKLMIIRTKKELLQLFLSLLFLSGAAFIFEQGVLFVLLYSIILMSLMVGLALQFGSNSSIYYQTKKLTILSLQALPIAALLFLVFPQLPPLWIMPSDQNSASTGLSDTIRPGDIANLSQSSELAFRANFETIVPAPPQRYWRALVLEHFDGEEWTISEQRAKQILRNKAYKKEFSLTPIGQPIDYKVYAEASRALWLFTLDAPIPANKTTQSKIWQTDTFAFRAEQPLLSAIAYDVQSYPSVKLNQTNKRFDQQLNLQLPKKGNPKTREWVETLRRQIPNNKDFAATVLNYFADPVFSYTLTPPLMRGDSIDDFLFEQQQGFCSHYASAMTFILRHAGIPARIVAGYHGGEMLDKQVMSIYQYDAHAWVEAWMDDEGWVRFDPTGVVAPERLTLGLEAALQNKDAFLANQALSLRKFKHISFFSSLRNTLNKVDYFWSRWVVGFDKEQQSDLFETIVGKITPEKLMYLMLSVVAIIALFLFILFAPKLGSNKREPSLTLYLSMVNKLEASSQCVRGTRSPTQYLNEVEPYISIEAFNHAKVITRLFVKSQYTNNIDSNQKSILSKMKYHFRKLNKEI
ncbi:DUF3488 domain-containing transglutaminase family protein [Alteromonas sp. 5E99-2]|uniref:transglutaminase family protein n=1 Tax=Alteromonas sp. 5E99-2 TaxID=2817683 RepID=UPI001A99C1C7|nr:DUF3488 and transglutaminase-like domain-containing protein [Alteromonas sp. 5E99-2]MBO1254871.1 DUF3488 domain-containing transglutaminase family protein [Alteromonas sp. 5E99-2]